MATPVTGRVSTSCCDFCNSPLWPLPRLRRHGCAQCPECRCVICLPRPSLADVLQVYEVDDYYTTQFTEAELKSKVSAHRTVAKRVRRDIGYGARVLEVGCGTGVLLAALRDEGLQAYGIDASGPAIDIARSVLGVDARQELIEDVDLSPNHDAIVALHVIEHLRQPSLLLRKARAALRPGGMLVLEVPDFGAHMRIQLGEQWPYFIPGEHLQHFDEGCLRHVCERFGFRPIRLQRLGGFGILQPGHGREGVAAAHQEIEPPGWRGQIYRTRRVLYRVPGVRPSVRMLNELIGYRILRRNSYIRIWATRR